MPLRKTGGKDEAEVLDARLQLADLRRRVFARLAAEGLQSLNADEIWIEIAGYGKAVPAGYRLPIHGVSPVVVVNLTWRLTGPLAQFNRSGLIQDIVRRLAATFAINLEASIDNRAPPLAASQGISAFGLFWSVIKARLFGR
jgi:hypothetical protein